MLKLNITILLGLSTQLCIVLTHILKMKKILMRKRSSPKGKRGKEKEVVKLMVNQKKLMRKRPIRPKPKVKEKEKNHMEQKRKLEELKRERVNEK